MYFIPFILLILAILITLIGIFVADEPIGPLGGLFLASLIFFAYLNLADFKEDNPRIATMSEISIFEDETESVVKFRGKEIDGWQPRFLETYETSHDRNAIRDTLFTIEYVVTYNIYGEVNGIREELKFK